jgi:hypothetical protein
MTSISLRECWQGIDDSGEDKCDNDDDFFWHCAAGKFVSTYELIHLVDYGLTKTNANKEEAFGLIKH